MIREALFSELKSELNKNKLDNRPLQIAIVGGSSEEPELALFHKGSKVTYFGVSKGNFDEPFVYLDANFFPNELSSDYLNAFDIVICINVLEHLFSATNGFANLCSLLNTNGYLWVVVPNCTFRHGSPDYYSAGYSVEFLQVMAEKDGLTTLISGNFGNSRQYRFEHLLGLWPTSNVLNCPLFSYFPISGTLLTKFLHQISTFHIRVILFLSKNKISASKDFALTSYVLAKRPSPTV